MTVSHEALRKGQVELERKIDALAARSMDRDAKIAALGSRMDGSAAAFNDMALALREVKVVLGQSGALLEKLNTRVEQGELREATRNGQTMAFAGIIRHPAVIALIGALAAFAAWVVGNSHIVGR